MRPEPCALSADVDGARRFENIGLYHVPELHGELDGAGDRLRGRRGRVWEDGLVFSVAEEVFLHRPSRAARRVVVLLRALHALRRVVVVMTVLSLFLIVVRITPHGSIVSLQSCTIIWGSAPHACSTARNSQYVHSRATGLHGACQKGFRLGSWLILKFS